MSEKVEPGWRSSASPEEIVQRQEAAQERARETWETNKLAENLGKPLVVILLFLILFFLFLVLFLLVLNDVGVT